MSIEKWESSCGRVTLYRGDCLEVLPGLEEGSADAVVTDPPYGIGEAAGKNKSRSNYTVAKDYGSRQWDNAPPSPGLIKLCRDISKWQVIFGGNYFDLPPSSCWLV